ncbi:MAG: cadherin repeat domain-containing protein, partial [Opitutales bacterium]
MKKNEQNKKNEGYYWGHGTGDVGWAPIMGASYSKNLTQWSINEYLYGSNLFKDADGNYITTPQQDIEVITTRNNNVTFRSDDHGENHSTASPLEIFPNNLVNSSGIISTRTDVDAFVFTTTGGQIDLNIDPESIGPNLDLYAALYDDQGTLLQSSNPDTAINATLSSTLTAGSYTVRVSGTGRGDPLDDGYTDYGSQGSYSISGTVVGGSQPQRLSLEENPANNAVVGNISTNNDHGTDSLSYAITAGNDSNAFALNSSSGSLTVADPAQFNYESLSSGFDEPAEFELTVTITNATRPTLNETRRVIVTVTDVNEAPVITGGSTFIPEGLRAGTTVLQASLSDPDHYDTHTWSITSGNTGGVFTIDNEGRLTVASPPNYD